jgi:hypothetical protein
LIGGGAFFGTKVIAVARSEPDGDLALCDEESVQCKGQMRVGNGEHTGDNLDTTLVSCFDGAAPWTG